MSSGTSRLSCLAVGHITHDRYGDRYAAGGSVLYAAKTLKALGADVGVATAFGDDFLFESKMENIELIVTPSTDTTVFENTYPQGASRLMLVEHPAADVLPDALTKQWQSPDVLFLAPVIGEVPLEAWLSTIKGTPIIGLGLQGFLKQKGGPHREGHPGCALKANPFFPTERLLQRVTAVFLSQEDLEVYGDSTLLDMLVRCVPIVAVTDGEKGAILFLDGLRSKTVGIRQTKAVDPTGAGDTFAASFLFALASGESPIQAAKLGSAAASIVVEATGPATVNRVGEASKYKDAIRVTDC